jgi:hypothetical protein
LPPDTGTSAHAFVSKRLLYPAVMAFRLREDVPILLLGHPLASLLDFLFAITSTRPFLNMKVLKTVCQQIKHVSCDGFPYVILRVILLFRCCCKYSQPVLGKLPDYVVARAIEEMIR